MKKYLILFALLSSNLVYSSAQASDKIAGTYACGSRYNIEVKLIRGNGDGAFYSVIGPGLGYAFRYSIGTIGTFALRNLGDLNLSYSQQQISLHSYNRITGKMDGLEIFRSNYRPQSIKCSRLR